MVQKFLLNEETGLPTDDAFCVAVDISSVITPTSYFFFQASFDPLNPDETSPVWFNIFLTSYMPGPDVPAGRGYYVSEGRFFTAYDSQITVQQLYSFRPEYNNLTTYSMSSNFNGESGGLNLVSFNFRASGLGADVLEEQDPLDVVTLLGSLFGYVPTILAGFAALFSVFIKRNLRQAEEQKITRLIEVHKGGLQA
ncbi:hypothetical protein JKP88DRAFT_353930 [Tribonema minus]|uniref:Uncharacterized protein n=1 Tax=Tribonema minus TaxID=303371 RepID=A0A836CIL2_9STRA|nr:hypothetical protein JKP88DRAFT_353930 [Tribonema minus]